MNVIVCEGHNDGIWLEKLLCSMKRCNSLKKSGELENLQRVVRNIEYLEKTYDVAIYIDKGKNFIIDKVVPRIAKDFVGVHQNLPEFMIIMDRDGISLRDTVESLKNKIEAFRTIDAEIEARDNHIRVVSARDERYSVQFSLILVPDNLEIRIVRKAQEKRIIKRYQSGNPHEQLKELADHLSMTKDKLLGLTIKENWFSGEEWFEALRKEIRLFIPLSTGD